MTLYLLYANSAVYSASVYPTIMVLVGSVQPSVHRMKWQLSADIASACNSVL